MKRTEPNVYRRTLARAIEIAGDQESLARFLACTPKEIAKWASGESNPPDADRAGEPARGPGPKKHLDPGSEQPLSARP